MVNDNNRENFEKYVMLVFKKCLWQ